MHHIFTITEMLSEILSWVSPNELAATACVNHLWFTVSIPKLWKDVEFKTALCLLGADGGSLHLDRYYWRFDPTPEKWERFKIYSEYIQVLSGNQHDRLALEMVAKSRPTAFRYLFPNCRSLIWEIFTNQGLCDFSSLISPNLNDFCLQVHYFEPSFFHYLCNTLKASSPTLKFLQLSSSFVYSTKTKECQDLFHDLLTFFAPHLRFVQIPEELNSEETMQKLYEIPELSHLVIDFPGLFLAKLNTTCTGNNGRGGFSALENLVFVGCQASLCDRLITPFNIVSLQELRWYPKEKLSNVDSFIKIVVEYCPQIQTLEVGGSRMYCRSREPRPVVSWQTIRPLLQCQKLHDLSLHCFQISMDLTELEELLTNRVAWTGIQLYTQDPWSLYDLLLFSKHCPGLKRLGGYVSGFLTRTADSDSIPFPHLTSLDLAYSILSPSMAPSVAAFLFKFCEKPPNLKGWDYKFTDSVSAALSELYIDRAKRTGVPMSDDVKLFVECVKLSSEYNRNFT